MRLYIEEERKKKEPDERNYCTPRRGTKEVIYMSI